MKIWNEVIAHLALLVVSICLCATAQAQTPSAKIDTTASSKANHPASDSVFGQNPPPTAFEVGSADFGSALITADYTSISQSKATGGSEYGVSASMMTDPFNQDDGHGVFGPMVDMIAGYHAIDQSGTGSTLTAGGSIIWNRSQLRFGFAVGFQTDAGVISSGRTWNFGGFGEWFPSSDVTLFGKLAKISGPASGNFIGVSAYYYYLPDLAFNAGFTSISFSVGYEIDLTAQVEYLYSETTPVSIFGGYTFSTLSNYNTGQVFIGLKFHFNGDGVNTLQDRERTGEQPPAQFKF